MMRRILATPAVLAACLLAVAPAQAQFGGLLRKVTTPAPKPSDDGKGGCPKGKKGNSIGRNILGNVINDAVGDAASKAGVYSYVPIGEVSGTLTDAVACRLDPGEQVQAASPCHLRQRGGRRDRRFDPVDRPDSAATVKVASINTEGGGRRCMNVTDFIIVEGEETRVTKRMCKEPGQTRYVVAA